MPPGGWSLLDRRRVDPATWSFPLPGAVRAAQRDPVALLDAEADAAAHGRAAIAHRDVPKSYDLCLNSGKLGVEGTAKAIKDYVSLRNNITDAKL